MQFSSITIDVVQPNRTIETLVAQIFAEVGATVRLHGHDDDASKGSDEGAEDRVADLLLFDMDASSKEGATELLAEYQEQEEGPYVEFYSDWKRCAVCDGSSDAGEWEDPQ